MGQGDNKVILKVSFQRQVLERACFPATKEQPKEMLPIFSRNIKGWLSGKPVVCRFFWAAIDAGLREFCYVLAAEKRGMKPFFTPDVHCIRTLGAWEKNGQASDFREFLWETRYFAAMWVNQPEQKDSAKCGFDGSPFVQKENCLVHAGDSCIISKNMDI